MNVKTNYLGSSVGSWRETGNNTLWIETKNEDGATFRSPRFSFCVEDFFGEIFRLVICRVNEIIYPNFISRVTIFISYDGNVWKPVDLEKRGEVDFGNYEFEFKTNSSCFFVSSYPGFEREKIDTVIDSIKTKFPNLLRVESSLGALHIKNITILKPRVRNVIVCGQHPGETIAYFFATGFIKEMHDFISNGGMFTDVEFDIFPYIDIDSYLSGVHRMSKGFDLNRSWDTLVSGTQKNIRELISTDVNVFDIHGDEVSKISYVQETQNPKQKSNKFLPELIRLRERSKFFRTLKKIILGIKTSNKGLSLFELSSKLRANCFLVELSMVSLLPEDVELMGRRFFKEVNSS